MDLLDLRTGQVVRTLIPKIAEGIFDVIATFTKTNEYVLYYHSGRKTIRSPDIIFKLNLQSNFRKDCFGGRTGLRLPTTESQLI